MSTQVQRAATRCRKRVVRRRWTETAVGTFPGAMPSTLPTPAPLDPSDPDTPKVIGRPPGRGLPTGLYRDEDQPGALLAEVRHVVGNADDRQFVDRGDDGARVLSEVLAVLKDQTGAAPTADQKATLRRKVFRGESAERIARYIVAERYRLSERDVLWMQRTSRQALDPAGRAKRKATIVDGQPRPAVTLIYR